MKLYQKLKLPKNSAWDRVTWRRHIHWRIKYLIDGIHNIIKWVPTLFHDRDWDDYFITKLLQKKIEHQRAHLVESNRHTRVDEDNYWMTVVLNLLEREHEAYYECEYLDYIKQDMIFKDYEGKPDYKILELKTKWENLDEYLDKYPGSIRRVLKRYPEQEFTKDLLAMYVARYNQEKCRNLLFEILKRYSNRWWD
jgi:hypothetical protein